MKQHVYIYTHVFFGGPVLENCLAHRTKTKQTKKRGETKHVDPKTIHGRSGVCILSHQNI